VTPEGPLRAPAAPRPILRFEQAPAQEQDKSIPHGDRQSGSNVQRRVASRVQRVYIHTSLLLQVVGKPQLRVSVRQKMLEFRMQVEVDACCIMEWPHPQCLALHHKQYLF